jgi:hypothetical protein
MKEKMDKHSKEIEEKMLFLRRNYKGPYCCFDMDSMLDKSDGEPIYKIEYDLSTREYFLESVEGYICAIQFCPWCGFQLPKSLHNTWFDMIEALGIDPWISEEKEKIPAEFLTDEWWKKRNL